MTAPIPAESILELPGACATFYEEAFARYEELRRKRVERIIAAGSHNFSKAAGLVARVVRDRLMPMTMKLTKPEMATWQYDQHIDWAAAA
ncbi:MAG TPA: hypothetical protein VF086_16625 [Propionibacteriaceae bacterium]